MSSSQTCSSQSEGLVEGKQRAGDESSEGAYLSKHLANPSGNDVPSNYFLIWIIFFFNMNSTYITYNWDTRWSSIIHNRIFCCFINDYIFSIRSRTIISTISIFILIGNMISIGIYFGWTPSLGIIFMINWTTYKSKSSYKQLVFD